MDYKGKGNIEGLEENLRDMGYLLPNTIRQRNSARGTYWSPFEHEITNVKNNVPKNSAAIFCFKEKSYFVAFTYNFKSSIIIKYIINSFSLL